jgi:hypothetical protein
MAARYQVRRDLASVWTTVNPILASGEMGYETDTLKFKIGDGITRWVTLAYLPSSNLAGHDIQRNAVTLPKRTVVNFVGNGVEVTDVGEVTTVSVAGHTNIDGGAARSVYTQEQILSGGRSGLMATIIQLRRDTASAWISANPVLGEAELGVETDTGNIKLGDGVMRWNSLDYIITGSSSPSPTSTGKAVAMSIVFGN